MSEYKPDRWVVLKFQTADQRTTYKVLGSWGGSYLHGQSWKLNSGCVRAEQDGSCLLFHGHSGSVYRCPLNSYGMTSYAMQILASWQRQFDEDTAGNTLMLMPEDTNFLAIDYQQS